MSRTPPDPTNHAAVRVHERLEQRARDNPSPPRSEVVDLMVQEAWKREEEIEAAKAERAAKSGASAIVEPVRPINRAPRPTVKSDANVPSGSDAVLAGASEAPNNENPLSATYAQLADFLSETEPRKEPHDDA
ncbi:hypothetical protein KDX27_39090 [Burkholderia cenocepacia]|uniref:hypothetical protein n=1 Tax=Burkholderia cenocepacia TaxID=95486 RepID=UPI001BA1F1FF|nr:hypothetical protein [Burkholderia cenocepacia]MBR8029906.1 hypothetical protein [Burkholderia cenocepacia]MBR8173698.1 hypothetical protein [Burkholderia cenocepacia]